MSQVPLQDLGTDLCSGRLAPVEPGSLVLVTGVNGYIASTVALLLLEKGYKVRGTVRSLTRGAYVQNEFKKFGDNFELVEVPDVAAPAAFKEAMNGVDAAIHTSAPVTFDAKKPEEQYVPSIGGTMNIMRSAHETPSVKRVMYLGSLGSAVMTGIDASKEVFTRERWNIMTQEAVKNLDDPAIGFHIYLGAKLEAEIAAWNVIKPQYAFTTFLGAIVIGGPILREFTSPPRQDQGLGQLYDVLANPPRVDGISPVKSGESAHAIEMVFVPDLLPEVVWIHVYDFAELFVASLTSDKAVGKRLLGVAGRMSWAGDAEIIRKEFPSRPFPPVKADAPTLTYPGSDVAEFDTELEKELLGHDWRPLEEAVLSTARDLIAKESKGWDKPAA
ncbi:uncharacterized protein PHACADRAFT_199737 [Phanerochaete carnosa HHB-10118-sp]|uniref:NAD-dependent epimerase/dehydratase domain-containing protein n=1 Tax=Phanerochaete carnosa (strain HHB-10118-sp) TaxID=650164 RepID=K5WKW5_PHACS|nr:uncharacterized protein PHACADRAFT_199737 [Phanerochaete carnosa HHB-10118-sp]EKM50897.1 hypothetical protein PHACADRAFT_199737 [Phanerochaete carnosa HHB-10118-sp]